jgi:hypothetical protein
VAVQPRERLAEEAEAKRVQFESTLNEFVLRRQQQESQLLFQYRQGLADLRRTVQQDGNYEGVISVQKALDEYVQTNKLGEVQESDIEELALLKRTMEQIRDEQAAISARQLIASLKKYTATLDDLRKTYTQQGEMEMAGKISDELQRVKSNEIVMKNEALLAKLGASAGAVALSGSSIANVSAVPELETINTVRDKLRVDLDRLDREASEALGDWPQQYIAALRSLMETFRLSGNFNAWEAASAELARFEEIAELRQEDLHEFPEELNQTQTAFLLQRRTVMESRDSQKRQVYREYLSKLETLKSTLTKRGQMDAASTVNQILRMIRQEPRYLALERGGLPTMTTDKVAPSTSTPSAKEE